LLRVYDYEEGDFEIPTGNNLLPVEKNSPSQNATNSKPSNFSASNEPPKFTPAQMVIENLVDNSVANIPAVLSADDIREVVFSANSPADLEEKLALLLDKQDPRFADLLTQTMLSAQLLGFVNSHESVI